MRQIYSNTLKSITSTLHQSSCILLIINNINNDNKYIIQNAAISSFSGSFSRHESDLQMSSFLIKATNDDIKIRLSMDSIPALVKMQKSRFNTYSAGIIKSSGLLKEIKSYVILEINMLKKTF